MSAGGYLRATDIEWKNSSDASLAKIAVTADTLTLSSAGSGVTLAGCATLTGLAAPSGTTDAVNKAYVDQKLQGISWKEPVRVAATSNYAASNNGSGVLTASGNGALSLGGISSFTAADRVLLTAQTTAADNGIYVVTNAGGASAQAVLTRAGDADSSDELQSAAVFVGEGSEADKAYVQTTDGSITLNSTSLAFVAFSNSTVTAGDGLGSSGSTLSVNVTGALEIASDTVQVAAGGITASHIATNAVTSAELADNAVDTAAVADDAVTAAKIATDAVTADAIAANAVGASELADNAVDTAAVATGAITSAKMDTNIALSGTMQAVSFQATSDRRKKENIFPLSTDECLEKCCRAEPVRYNFKQGPEAGRQRIGFIAQDCEHWCSESVADGADGYKSISYCDWVPLLCGAVQSLTRQIEELKDEHERLKLNAGEQ
jgi:hypothetical protein